MGRVPDVQEEEEEEGCAQSTPGAGTGGFRALTKLPLITDPFLPLAGTKKKRKKPQKFVPGPTKKKTQAELKGSRRQLRRGRCSLIFCG